MTNDASETQAKKKSNNDIEESRDTFIIYGNNKAGLCKTNTFTSFVLDNTEIIE